VDPQVTRRRDQPRLPGARDRGVFHFGQCANPPLRAI
jgi:hypothetical protein